MADLRREARRELVEIEQEAVDLFSLMYREGDACVDDDMLRVYRRRAANIREALDRLDRYLKQLGDLT